MTTLLVYVDAENVSYSDFRNYYEASLSNKAIVGKVYGNSSILGTSVMDYIRMGFEYVDTSMLSDSSKNVADMKIVTDCAFDVLQTFNCRDVAVTILTKDCDFLPLVYKLAANGITVDVPMLGKDKTMTVPMSTITELLQKHNYNPMSNDTWKVPQIDLIYDLVKGEISYDFVDRYCMRKRNRFIRAIAMHNPSLATKFDAIPKDEFSAESIYKVMRRECVQADDVLAYMDMYTNKYFGKSFKLTELQHKLNNFR